MTPPTGNAKDDVEMDMSIILILAGVVSLLANTLKVWEFAAPSLGRLIKKTYPLLGV